MKIVTLKTSRRGERGEMSDMMKIDKTLGKRRGMRY